jgi:pimeloyl-ACP methyl ester carboxylesterase
VVGALDRITPPPIAEQVAAALAAAPGRSLTVIPGAGHAICQEQPDAVASILIRLAGQIAEHAAEV